MPNVQTFSLLSEDRLEVSVHVPEAVHRGSRKVVQGRIGAIGPRRQHTGGAREDSRRGGAQVRRVTSERIGEAPRRGQGIARAYLVGDAGSVVFFVDAIVLQPRARPVRQIPGQGRTHRPEVAPIDIFVDARQRVARAIRLPVGEIPGITIPLELERGNPRREPSDERYIDRPLETRVVERAGIDIHETIVSIRRRIFVTRLMAPPVALRPNKVPCGPRSISTRSRSKNSIDSRLLGSAISFTCDDTPDSPERPTTRRPIPRMLRVELPKLVALNDTFGALS